MMDGECRRLGRGIEWGSRVAVDPGGVRGQGLETWLTVQSMMHEAQRVGVELMRAVSAGADPRKVEVVYGATGQFVKVEEAKDAD